MRLWNQIVLNPTKEKPIRYSYIVHKLLCTSLLVFIYISMMLTGIAKAQSKTDDIVREQNTTKDQSKESSIDKSKYEIVIPKPENVTSSMISDEDYYNDSYFVITLKGDFLEFYNSHPISSSASMIDDISVSLNDNRDTEVTIVTSKLQGYEFVSDHENIYVHIGNPRSIYKNIVVLDPGHGGSAEGAKGYNEKNINLDILYTIGKKYFNKDSAKLKVYYTRTSDVDMSLAERAAFAKKVGADLFVSLHMNSAPDVPNANGTEVFYSTSNNTANATRLTSKKLATMLQKQLYPALGTNNRGVKHENYYVIHRNTVPAVLIELGFLTNDNDYAVLSNQKKREATAKVIYNTLLKVFELYPTGR